MKNTLLFGLLLLLFTSCFRTNIAEHENFVGVWENTNKTKTLSIDANGKSQFAESEEIGNIKRNKNFNGPFKLNDGILDIGFIEFHIEKMPHQIDSVWTMQIQDEVFIKIEE